MTDKKPKPTKRQLTTDKLRAMGFIVPPSTGQGFGLPLTGPQPKPAEPTPPAKRGPLTDEELIARGWKQSEAPADRGYFLPAHVPPPKKRVSANKD
jgi:hypothetical protein